MSGYKGVCICYMAIFALPGGYSLGTFPTIFLELLQGEVRRIPLPRTLLNKTPVILGTRVDLGETRS